jgi:hypothetical protein
VSRSAAANVPEGWIDPFDLALHVPGFGRIPPFQHLRTKHGMVVWAPFPGQVPSVTTVEWDRPADDGVMSLAEMRASAERVLAAELPLAPPVGEGPFLLRRLQGGNTRLAARFRRGRVLLLGDAAHVHSTMGGPGLNLGLQDALNLGWKLAAVIRGRCEQTLLDTYEVERRPVSQRVLMYTQAQAALIAPGPEVTALRELFAELLTQPNTVAYIAGLISGADIRYPAEPHEHPLVGRWAPDFTVVTADGWQRLADLTHDGRPVLVDLTGGRIADRVTNTADGIAIVVGHGGDDRPANAMLIRPDGYVAWATSDDPPTVAGLDEAATRWFGITLTGDPAIRLQ